MDRRTFVRRTAVVAGAAAIGDGLTLLPTPAGAQQNSESAPVLSDAIQHLRPILPAVVPISDAERLARIEKARRLMRETGIAAIFLEPGSSMYYYTGVRWGLSERTFGVVIPAVGDLAYITPG
ncbi:MAG: aminopeptidase P family N-terminal domain-containing protein, partial [Gemmatimonadales bacterium]